MSGCVCSKCPARRGTNRTYPHRVCFIVIQDSILFHSVSCPRRYCMQNAFTGRHLVGRAPRDVSDLSGTRTESVQLPARNRSSRKRRAESGVGRRHKLTATRFIQFGQQEQTTEQTRLREGSRSLREFGPSPVRPQATSMERV